MLAFRGGCMKFSKASDLYNSNKIDLTVLLLMITRETGQEYSYNACYYFAKDIMNKNENVRPITLTSLNNTFSFINGEDTLFNIDLKLYNRFDSNESLLRTNIFPNTDENGCCYDIYNDQYQLGVNGLY